MTGSHAANAVTPLHGDVEIPAPKLFVGRTLKQLELRPKYGLTLIAVKRRPAPGGVEVTNISPRPTK